MTKPTTRPATKAVSAPWPSTPLDAAQRAFEGLPQRILPLDELKKFLIHNDTPRPVRDTVWRELVVRAPRDGPAWVIATVGLAMPGLRRAAGRLAAGWRADTADLDGELLAGFLTRLHTLDL